MHANAPRGARMQRSEIRGNAANGSTGPGLRFAPSGLRPSLRAKRSNPALSPRQRKLDCFVALLLAMTGKERTLRHRFARHDGNYGDSALNPTRKKFSALNSFSCMQMHRAKPGCSEAKSGAMLQMERPAPDC